MGDLLSIGCCGCLFAPSPGGGCAAVHLETAVATNTRGGPSSARLGYGHLVGRDGLDVDPDVDLWMRLTVSLHQPRQPVIAGVTLGGEAQNPAFISRQIANRFLGPLDRGEHVVG